MLRKFFTSVSFLPLILCCAPLQQVAADPLVPDQSSLIDATCTSVMGLQKGETYFDACRDSLKHSLARKLSAAASVSAYDSCRNLGLAQGTAALSVCILNAQNGPASSSAHATLQPASLLGAKESIEGGKSYFDVTPRVRWQREQYSCAQLGLMPSSGLFGTCVASLEGALLPDSN